jgi:hypothetical protein
MPCLSVFTALQAMHGSKMIFFGMDGKRRIPIVSFLGCIPVAFGEMHRKAGWKTVSSNYLIG